ncbi:MAG: cytochrome c-type biogenesis CcmF C-terminal domain-containing protein [Bacteroidota bacterium]
MIGLLGSIFLSLSFALAIVAGVSYTLALRRDENAPSIRFTVGRAGFHSAVIFYMFTVAALMFLVLTLQFQYKYVYEHASTHLSKPLLMASFYAGQEGSFMLWTLLTALISVFVLGYAQRVKYEAQVMAPLMLVLTLLLLIIIVKSPFLTIYEAYPAQNLPLSFVPPDGKGLNPTLENLWITIHPPILFTGFASMTVPFVFAVAGLLKRDYQRWITISLPWVLFSCMSLGFGIMLGGWWAYETLGWGGFWAWDPVENSSLIPWLCCVGLVHTMLVQKRTGVVSLKPGTSDTIGGFVKTNFVLAICTFGLILYSTFLTRSGVLGDTSVHSFVDAGNFVYWVLLAIIIIFLVLGFGVLARRWKDLNRVSHSFAMMSRETALGLGSAVILASAVVVLLGTSAPIIIPIFGGAKYRIPTEYYNSIHLPLATVLVLLNAISMRMKWKNSERNLFFRQMMFAVCLAVVGTIGLALLGITDPTYVGLGFGSLLAIIVNMQIGLKVMRGKPGFVGAYVSHTGISLLMLGVIFTSRYTQTEHIQLVEGKPKSVFDYSMVYLGPERIEEEKVDREKYQHRIILVKNGDTSTVLPVTFVSDFNDRKEPFAEPGILYRPNRDIYLFATGLEEEGGAPRDTLHKGDKVRVPFDSSITLRFEKFDMSRAASEGKQGVVMEVATKDSTYYLTSYRAITSGDYTSVPIPGTDIGVGMYAMIADSVNLSNSRAILRFTSRSHPMVGKQVISLDASIKPFISFVWAGVVIMVGGFFFSLLRRRKELTPLLGVIGEETGGREIAARPRRNPGGLDDPIAARNALRR